jgi:hypothetical protein
MLRSGQMRAIRARHSSPLIIRWEARNTNMSQATAPHSDIEMDFVALYSVWLDPPKKYGAWLGGII